MRQLRKGEIQEVGCPTCGADAKQPCQTKAHSEHERKASHEARMWLAQDVKRGRPIRRHRKGRDAFYLQAGYPVRARRRDADKYGGSGEGNWPTRLVMSQAQIDRRAARWDALTPEEQERQRAEAGRNRCPKCRSARYYSGRDPATRVCQECGHIGQAPAMSENHDTEHRRTP